MYIFHFDLIDSRINTDEEGVVHDYVAVAQVPRNPVGDLLIRRMTEKIAAEEVSGLDAVGFQEWVELLGDILYCFCQEKK